MMIILIIPGTEVMIISMTHTGMTGIMDGTGVSVIVMATLAGDLA